MKRSSLIMACIVVIALSLAGLHVTNAKLFDPKCLGHEIEGRCN